MRALAWQWRLSRCTYMHIHAHTNTVHRICSLDEVFSASAVPSRYLLGFTQYSQYSHHRVEIWHRDSVSDEWWNYRGNFSNFVPEPSYRGFWSFLAPQGYFCKLPVWEPRRIRFVRILFIHGAAASQEIIPFDVGNFLFASHDLSAQHEGEHDFIAFEQTSARANWVVQKKEDQKGRRRRWQINVLLITTILFTSGTCAVYRRVMQDIDKQKTVRNALFRATVNE